MPWGFPFSQESSPTPPSNRRVRIGYDVPETEECQTDVCYEAAKTPSLSVYPQGGEGCSGSNQPVDLGSTGRPRCSGNILESLSAKGLTSYRSSGGFGLQGERRFPVRPGRGGMAAVGGGEAGSRSGLISTPGFCVGTQVSVCPAADAQAALGPVRPGRNLGTAGSSSAGAGPSDGQGTPDAGPALGVLQAAGRQAPVLRVPTIDHVVVSLPGAG